MQKISCKKREKSVKKTHNYTKCIFEIVKIKINIVNIQKRIAIRKTMWKYITIAIGNVTDNVSGNTLFKEKERLL